MHGGEGLGCALEGEPEDPVWLAALALCASKPQFLHLKSEGLRFDAL